MCAAVAKGSVDGMTTHTSTRAALLAGVAATAVTMLASIETTAVAGTEPTTLTFRGVVHPRDLRSHDIRPRGDSIGDRHMASMTLRSGGEIAGRLEGICTTIDNTYDGHMCTLVVILPDGRLAFEGAGVRRRIPNVGGRGDIFALTGGTGAYVGVDGVLKVEPGDNGDIVTISLQ